MGWEMFADEDGAPCCAAVVTSGGDYHEPGCPFARSTADRILSILNDNPGA